MTKANYDLDWTERRRPNCVYEPAPGGGFIVWPATSVPEIVSRHIDGPYIRFRNGEIQWLTLRERAFHLLGWITAEDLEEKYRPELRVWAAEAQEPAE